MVVGGVKLLENLNFQFDVINAFVLNMNEIKHLICVINITFYRKTMYSLQMI